MGGWEVTLANWIPSFLGIPRNSQKFLIMQITLANWIHSFQEIPRNSWESKSCICSTIDSSRLFLHWVSSHHYLYHQGIHRLETKNRSEKSEWSCALLLTLQSASQRIYFASQWQVLKDPRDHARDRKQRRLHLALIFECTFHRLITFLNCFA